MIVSGEDAEATLRLVVPGFVALQIFYWFGLATKRTDWRWLIWSLIASVPLSALAAPIVERIATTYSGIAATSADLAAAIAACGRERLADELRPAEFEEALQTCGSNAIHSHNALPELAIAVGLGVLAGLLGAGIWRLAIWLRPSLRYGQELLAWSRVLRPGRWLQVKVKDDKSYYGWSASIADPVETEELDIYLAEPKMLTTDGWKKLDGLEGILIRRDDILFIEVLLPKGGTTASERRRSRLTWRERLTGRSDRIDVTGQSLTA